MRVIALSALQAFWRQAAYQDAAQAGMAWFKEASQAQWASPADVKAAYGNASILKGGRVVFNIAGNKYRLVVWINYDYFTVYVRFIGTHKQYDAIDVDTI
jgi:mRNA interferase HigB